MANFTILRPGLFTTVQDCGRWGYQAQGVPVAGAKDLYSHRLANRIVGNPGGAASLEVTLMGPSVEFADAAVFAVTGAEFQLMLNDSPVAMYQPVKAAPGTCLRFAERVRGARAYIAFEGGLDVPVVLGSRSTHTVSHMGGYQGRALRAGDVLPTGTTKRGRGSFSPVESPKKTPVPFSMPAGGATLRVIPGGLIDHISGRRFTISTASDRMGYRLKGIERNAAAVAGLISSAVPTGTIQVPPGGEPILLMADHATVGGYAVAGTVISADLPLAGQLAPGDWIEFEPCSAHDALEALRASEAALARGVA